MMERVMLNRATSCLQAVRFLRAATTIFLAMSMSTSVAGQTSAAESILRREIERSRTPGLQYIHVDRDSVLFRYDAGVADVGKGVAVTRSTTFNGFSTTKTFTAVAILQLAERGLLDLDAPAAEYMRDFPYPANITVRHLLTHSSGIPNPIPLKWVHLVDEHATFDRNAFFRTQYSRHNKVKAPAGTRFGYSNLGYELLGEIIESVSGRTYEEYVTENILERIGIPANELGFSIDGTNHARGYHRRASLSYPVLGLLVDGEKVLGERVKGWRAFRPYYMNGAAYGGLVGTVDGYARYVQALLDSSSPLLSATSREILFAENILVNGQSSGMSASWFIGKLGDEPFFDHAGGGGGYYAELRIYPEIGRGSVLLMNRTGMKNDRLLSTIDRELVRAARSPGARAYGVVQK
jgi:D-alanyl-D-alanine carboxypeptidase